MNDNSYYIIFSSIPCNIDSYYTVITITMYKFILNLLMFAGVGGEKKTQRPGGGGDDKGREEREKKKIFESRETT
jgi:hypothetical protein